jgi:hypothetical protein
MTEKSRHTQTEKQLAGCQHLRLPERPMDRCFLIQGGYTDRQTTIPAIYVHLCIRGINFILRKVQYKRVKRKDTTYVLKSRGHEKNAKAGLKHREACLLQRYIILGNVKCI